MRRSMHPPQMPRFNARLDLRRRQARMPEQRLDRPQVRPVRQQMRRKAMS